MAINRYAEPLNIAIRDNDLTRAHAALDTNQARTHTFDSMITLYTAEEISQNLETLGCPVTGHYGILSVCGYITDDVRKHDQAFYAELEQLELALTDRHPYRHTARIFQLTARKQAGS
jgi:S-adenosylmethionine-dependent methyltransferase